MLRGCLQALPWDGLSPTTTVAARLLTAGAHVDTATAAARAATQLHAPVAAAPTSTGPGTSRYL